jgi:hypothetical protein
LARSNDRLAESLDRNSSVIEMLLAVVPAKRRAALLGVGLHRERSMRRRQAAELLAKGKR